MKSKLLNKKSIPPACEYCTRGSGAPDGKTVLCPKKGVMQKDSSCSAFRYDPLKRKPKQPSKSEKQKNLKKVSKRYCNYGGNNVK